jgi:heptose I phosphotransferase
MSLQSRDRLHFKQGRSTARFVFEQPRADQTRGDRPARTRSQSERPLAVYLKRHYRLPLPAGLAALFHPGGRHSPGAAEWAHLERARSLGVPVPEVVAAGERIGPWAHLQSYLIVAELTGCTELNVVLPELVAELDSTAFAVLKRKLITEIARITAALHNVHVFHKDLYLCHFYLDRERLRLDPSSVRLVLIDLHRLGEHRFWPDWWRWKDLGQLLYSAHDVAGIEKRDILRFWVHYCRLVHLRRPSWQARMIRLKAARYMGHNRDSALRLMRRTR